MFSKRGAVLLCLGVSVSAVVGYEWNADQLVRLRAHHVRETTLVSAGNRRLAGFFDGLAPNPHWNATQAAEAAREIHNCGATGGVLARLLSIFVPTVHAQTGCTSGGCGGSYVNVTSYDCGGGCSGYSFPQPDGTDQCSAYNVDGSTGCVGAGCTYVCNVSGCSNPSCGGGGGCIPNGGNCTDNSQCCSGICSLEAGCQSSE